MFLEIHFCLFVPSEGKQSLTLLNSLSSDNFDYLVVNISKEESFQRRKETVWEQEEGHLLTAHLCFAEILFSNPAPQRQFSYQSNPLAKMLLVKIS